ncbi:hypothetical protein AURDEDRAFT_114037, partial [Auricularia subglabra TFB-10046 SS5]
MPKHRIDGNKGAAVPRCQYKGLVDIVATIDFAFYDPEVAAHDQREFVEKSVAKERALAVKQRGAPSALSEPCFTVPPHFTWTADLHNLPFPLGKFGQPSWSGSAWEDFNPLRLWDNIDGGIIHRGTPLWIQLVKDAAKLPFEFRSNAQRVVVSDGYRFVPRGKTKPILPFDGEVAELDVWSLCAQNAVSMPLAVRKQYAYHQASKTLYREWDAADMGIFLIMRACSPGKEGKEAKKKAAKSSEV